MDNLNQFQFGPSTFAVPEQLSNGGGETGGGGGGERLNLGTYLSEIVMNCEQYSLKKKHWKCRLQNGSHFTPVSMCW